MLPSNILTVSFLTCIAISSASKIAFFSTTGSKSHNVIFQSLIDELANRGHDVTVFSPFPVKEQKKGVNQVVLTSGKDVFKLLQNTFIPGNHGVSIVEFFTLFRQTSEMYCREAAQTPELKNALTGKVKYDVILLDQFFEDCAVAVAHKTKVPFIFVSTNVQFGQFSNNLRFPHPITHVPFLLSPFTDKMNFWQRLANLCATVYVNYYREHVYMPIMDEALREIFGSDLPPVLEMEKNFSMILLNSLVALNHPAPQLPHTKEVGGMHLRSGRPLPKHLLEWMEGAGPEGVIYFSLGTVLPASEMNDRYRNIFLQAFSKLPQRVVWKWETGQMEGLPPNVRVFKFLPQQDILAHNSTKAFITHGGLLSLQETTFHGVPAVGIPGGADQHYNMKILQSKRGGQVLSWDTITSDALLEALKTVIYDPSYKENMKKVSKIVRDQRSSPRDSALYWIEYVIRHNGASHFRSAALDLQWYEYYMVDLALFILSVLFTVFVILYFLLRFVFRILRNKFSQSRSLKKKAD